MKRLLIVICVVFMPAPCLSANTYPDSGVTTIFTMSNMG